MPDSLLWEEWETEYAIFNRSSGETHLINELPAQILRFLIEQPDHASGLAEKLANLCETGNNTSWQQQTSDIINNLASLGLIEVKRP
ncbi:MAG: HPr-rel-A system PqqD family peptide chaperone [Candidatus Polarisedimenticolaceae bacterium]|nr:HPr-rel-A system PqqD family peptide chaperone [Candidatus Polarisedimenticolaceae bacterium]